MRIIKAAVYFSGKLILLTAFLASQLFLSEIFLYQQNQDAGVLTSNIARADSGDAWYNASYLYRKKITIDHTKIPNTDQANFPVLISQTDANLKTIGNGGRVSSNSGYDIIFTPQAGNTKLDHEIESYDASTGTINMWVKIPVLSHLTDTVIYIYYGNADITNSQENRTAVWDGNFKAVWHMKEDPSGSAPQISDSTANGYYGYTAGGMGSGQSVAGKIGKAVNFNYASSNYIEISPIVNLGSLPITYEAWVYPTGMAAGFGYSIFKDSCNNPGVYIYSSTGFRIWQDIACASGSASYSGNISLNTPYHIVAVYNSATSRQLYVNGVPQTLNTSNASSTFYMRYLGRYFSGYMDEVRVSNNARSADWIAAEFNNQSSPSSFYALSSEEPKPESPLSTFAYRKAITIDHTKISGAGSLTDFPVLINLPGDASLVAHAQSDGDDILFASSTVVWGSDTTHDILAHEIENYDSATGSLQAWVKIPSVSASTDTVIYMYYGNASVASQQNKNAVWGNNARMVQHMNQDPAGAPPQMLDSTQYANNGTSGGTMTSGDRIAGKVGSASDFDGTDDYINSGSGSSLNITGSEITMSAWVKPSGANTWDYILQRAANAGGNSGYEMALQSGILRPNIRLTDWTLLDTVGVGPNLKDGLWHYVAATYNGTKMTAYVDGNSVASTADSSSTLNSNSANLVIGERSDLTCPFTGSIDETRVLSVARSADWIKTEYNNQSDSTGFSTPGIEEVVDPATLSSWPYRKTITIDKDQVSGSGSLANFPVLVNLATDADLLAHAQGDGDDILFASSDVAWNIGNQNDKLAHEIESYDSTTGNLQAWVNIPSLSSDVDTLIYMYYGNGTVADQQNKLSVWDSNTKLVQHMNQNPSGAAPQMKDSTQYINNGTSNGGMVAGQSVSGEIGKSLNFNSGNNNYVNLGTMGDAGSNLTLVTFSTWLKTTGATSEALLGNLNSNPSDAFLRIAVNTNPYNDASNQGKIQLILRSSGNDNFIAGVDTDTGVSDGNWHQLAITLNKATATANIYIDGIPQTVVCPLSHTGTSWINWNRDLFIGASQEGAGNTRLPFNGTIDEMHLSAGILRSSDWIKTEYANQSSSSSFLTLSGEQSFMDHFTIGGATSQIAGDTQNITLTAIDAFGSTDTLYTGDKTITLSGAGSVDSNAPTFTDKNDQEVAFGSSGAISFTSGVAHTTVKLFKAENAEIEASDGTYDTIGNASYDLNIAVSLNAINSFDIDSPVTITSETPFSLGLTSLDSYGNITTEVDNPTTLSINSGNIDTPSIPAVDFQDDGIFIGTITISNIPTNKDIILTISNGSIAQTVNLSVIGVAHSSSFVPPVKPSIRDVKVTVSDKGKLILENIPDSISQLAVSATSGFENASWEDISQKESLLENYGDANKLYLKFKTEEGGVSDVLIWAKDNSSSSLTEIIALNEGDIVKTPDSPDVYVIKYKNQRQYKRLILSPLVFKSYQHLKWENIKTISQEQLDRFTTSNLVKETLDTIIYILFPNDDTGERKPLNTSTPYDTDSVYEINKVDRDSYKLVK